MPSSSLKHDIAPQKDTNYLHHGIKDAFQARPLPCLEKIPEPLTYL